LKHCAIRGSSTGLPALAEITHSQYHGRSNAWKTNTVSPTSVCSTNTFSCTKPIRFAGSRSGKPIATCAAPTSLCGVTSAPSCFSSRPRRQLNQCARVLDAVINCNLKDWKALFDFQACRMCGLGCGKEPFRLLVNLEELTPKLEPTFLRNTLDDFFSRIPLRSRVSILT
jgi:hypothetical protein